MHERTPIFLGCVRDVEMIMELYGVTPDGIALHKDKRARVEDGGAGGAGAGSA